jgi:hypothetical protein
MPFFKVLSSIHFDIRKESKHIPSEGRAVLPVTQEEFVGMQSPSVSTLRSEQVDMNSDASDMFRKHPLQVSTGTQTVFIDMCSGSPNKN